MSDDDHDNETDSEIEDVDDVEETDEKLAKKAVVEDSKPPSSGSRRALWTVGVLALIAGLVIGGLATALVVGGDDEADPDCAEPIAIVNTSIENIDEINQAESQDGGLFSALVAEQRTVTFTMEDRPECFSLQDRASAAGLLDGLNGLIVAGVSSEAPPSEVTDPLPELEPEPDAEDDSGG